MHVSSILLPVSREGAASFTIFPFVEVIAPRPSHLVFGLISFARNLDHLLHILLSLLLSCISTMSRLLLSHSCSQVVSHCHSLDTAFLSILLFYLCLLGPSFHVLAFACHFCHRASFKNIILALPCPCLPELLANGTRPTLFCAAFSFFPFSGLATPSRLGCCCRLWSRTIPRFHLPLLPALHLPIPARDFRCFLRHAVDDGHCRGAVHGRCWPGAVMRRRDTMRWYLSCVPSLAAPAS